MYTFHSFRNHRKNLKVMETISFILNLWPELCSSETPFPTPFIWMTLQQVNFDNIVALFCLNNHFPDRPLLTCLKQNSLKSIMGKAKNLNKISLSENRIDRYMVKYCWFLSWNLRLSEALFERYQMEQIYLWHTGM